VGADLEAVAAGDAILQGFDGGLFELGDRAAFDADEVIVVRFRIGELVAGVAELPAFRAAHSVALFWPLLDKHEVDVRALDALSRELGKVVYYPGFTRSAEGVLSTDLRRTESAADLALRGQRFEEPPPDAPAAARCDIDLIVVPALAVALTGHRLGFGVGFYDSMLPDFCPPAVAVVVAFDFQLLAELPVEPHDVACDFVVTEGRSVTVPPPAGP